MSDKNLISFDYAIKYLLKDKADYDIVEGFISALIGEEGYKPVKIKSLLESESNKETRGLKKSIADLIVEDEDGNNYIIEIDRSYTDLFLHKACFNSSRLIVDNIGTNQDYLKIKKVFHINLLYFPLKNFNSKAPLHHGKVIFHEIDNLNPLDVHLTDSRKHHFDIHNVFPEYFIISIALFDGIVRKEIDEWLYMMQNSEVREDFKSPYMKKVAERLNILKMNQIERSKYYDYVSESLKGRDYIVSAREEGIQIGEAKGIEQGKIEIAKKMLTKNKTMEEIIELTELSYEQIEKLKT
jgi:predicted transposase/invertase (TIGR01784 family)